MKKYSKISANYHSRMRARKMSKKEVVILAIGMALGAGIGYTAHTFNQHAKSDKKAAHNAAQEISDENIVRVPITALDREGLKESDPETLAKMADAFNDSLRSKLAQDGIKVTRLAMTPDSIFTVPFDFVLPNREEKRTIDSVVVLGADTANTINQITAKNPKAKPLKK